MLSAVLWRRVTVDEKLFSILKTVHDRGVVEGFRELSRRTDIHPFQIRGYIVGREGHYPPLRFLVRYSSPVRGRRTKLELTTYGAVIFHLVTHPKGKEFPEIFHRLEETFERFRRLLKNYKELRRKRKKPRPALPRPCDLENETDQILLEVYRSVLRCPHCQTTLGREQPIFLDLVTHEHISLKEFITQIKGSVTENLPRNETPTNDNQTITEREQIHLQSVTLTDPSSAVLNPPTSSPLNNVYEIIKNVNGTDTGCSLLGNQKVSGKEGSNSSGKSSTPGEHESPWNGHIELGYTNEKGGIDDEVVESLKGLRERLEDERDGESVERGKGVILPSRGGVEGCGGSEGTSVETSKDTSDSKRGCPSLKGWREVSGLDGKEGSSLKSVPPRTSIPHEGTNTVSLKEGKIIVPLSGLLSLVIDGLEKSLPDIEINPFDDGSSYVVHLQATDERFHPQETPHPDDVKNMSEREMISSLYRLVYYSTTKRWELDCRLTNLLKKLTNLVIKLESFLSSLENTLRWVRSICDEQRENNEKVKQLIHNLKGDFRDTLRPLREVFYSFSMDLLTLERCVSALNGRKTVKPPRNGEG